MNNFERLMKFVEPVTESGCWIWMGHIMPNGYGQFRFQGRAMPAHRAAYAIIRGNMPAPKMDLDHLCRVRCCVNPDHLEPVTRRENLLRGDGAKLIGKKQCIRGHELPKNLFFAGTKKVPRCRECDRIRGQAHYFNRKEQEAVSKLLQRMVDRTRAMAAPSQPNQ